MKTRKVWLIVWSLCFCTLSAIAQIRGSEITVLVSPDHADWTYRLGEKCTFVVRALKAQNWMTEGVTVDYELGPEWFPVEKRQGVALKNGELKLSATMKTPGFLRCKVKVHVDDRVYDGLATAAYAPDQLYPATQMPDDFMAYWEEQARHARTLPLDTRMELMPERCTEQDNVYKVSFQTKPWGGRIFAILSVPKAEGRYPALLRVPGAGVRPYDGDTYTASGKLITLEMGIHGIPVDMPQPVYDAIASSALHCYWNFNRDDRNRFYYNRVIIGALRAVDLICSLPQYNGSALGVCGSSQGGALSIITAALDKRVTFCAPVHPALCDHEGFLNKRAGGWPHYIHNFSEPTQKELNVLRYYDVVNFAHNLTVPSWFSWGYNDEVCPPTSMYAAYNVVSAPKELHIYQETGHYWYQEQYDAWQAWIKSQLNID